MTENTDQTSAALQALDQLGQWVWVFDAHRTLVYANKPALAWLDKLNGGSSVDQYLAALSDEGVSFPKAMANAFDGGGHFSCTCDSGLKISVVVTCLAGGGASFVGRNDSMRDEALGALARADGDLNIVLDNMSDMFYRTDLNGTLMLVSRSAEKNLGYEPSELIGTDIANIYVDPAARQGFLNALEAGDGHIVGYEVQLRRKDGGMIWISTNAHYYRDQNGEVAGVEGISRDITSKRQIRDQLKKDVEERTQHIHREVAERKRIEASLIESEERYALAMDAAQDGIWDLDLESDEMYMSPSIWRLVGLSGGTTMKSLTFLANFVPPEDQSILTNSLQDHIKGKTDSMKCDYRIVGPDGNEHWVRNRSAALYRDGKAYRIVGAISDITEQRAMEQVLHDSEARFRDMTEAASDWYWEFDQDYKFTFVADRFFTLSGLKPEDIIGKGREVMEGLPGFELSEAAGQRHRESLAARLPFRNLEYSFLRPNNQRLYIRLSGKPHFDGEGEFLGYRGVGADITAQVISETRMHEAQQQLREAIETISEAFVVFDADDRLVLFNSKYLSMYPDVADKIVRGVHFEEIIRAGAERGAYADAIGRVDDWIAERMEAHREPTKPLEQELSNGRWVRVSERKMPGGGIVGIRSDITELKHSEARMREASRMSQQANTAKSEFLANMSHELRTPLNAIIGFSDVMRTEAFGPIGTPKYSEYSEAVHQSGLHLLALVEDMLDVARIEAGRMELTEEELDVAEIGSVCLELVQERAQENDLTLAAEIPNAMPKLFADKRRVRQILINLLSNAVKFTPNSGAVTLGASDDGANGVAVFVRDTGIGMTDAEMEKALEPFGQADSALSKRYEGTGLGLPLVEGLVGLHGGKMTIESTVGEGTTVTVRFPSERARAHTA